MIRRWKRFSLKQGRILWIFLISANLKIPRQCYAQGAVMCSTRKLLRDCKSSRFNKKSLSRNIISTGGHMFFTTGLHMVITTRSIEGRETIGVENLMFPLLEFHQTSGCLLTYR